MRIIVIGDLHGKNCWKEIVKQKMPDDLIVFMGDYFDSWHQTPEEQLKNFEEIVHYKKMYPEAVTLLIGNHDFQYMEEGRGERYSGYNHMFAESFRKALSENRNLLKVAKIIDGKLFTHAGVTKTWCKENGIDSDKALLSSNYADSLDNQINNLFLTKPDAFRFNRNCSEPTGNNIEQSPLWVRPESLANDKVPGLLQIVGHTRVQTPSLFVPGVTLVDSLDRGQYVIIEGENVMIKTV